LNLIKKLSLPSENVTRKKPKNFLEQDENIFKHEFTKHLPKVLPIGKQKSFIPPCGRLFNGICLNSSQFNIKIKLHRLIKAYLESFLFLFKIKKITKFDNILYLTNASSPHFFHWFLDILQKLEFISQRMGEVILNSKLKIIIPNDHNNNYIKKSLEAFEINFHYQEKNEMIVGDKSILLPDIAPSGNYRKHFLLKVSQRLKNHWVKKRNITFNKKRIYISRKNSTKRKIKNEDKIIPILKYHKFTIVDFDKINFEEQLKYTLNSEILVSIHGAGLTHMLWMKKKSKILEIRANNNTHDNCYFTMASDLGHDYFYLNADKTDLKKPNYYSDLEVNTDQFLLQLLKML
jgi:capsular polysaccharide biosynthesis protein